MITVRERMDILSAYREVGSYRGAADICGTTPKTVKRAVLADAAKNATAGRGGRPQLRRRPRCRRRAGREDPRSDHREASAARRRRGRLRRLGPQLPASRRRGEGSVAPVEPSWPPAGRVVTGRHARDRLGRDRAAVGVLRGAGVEPLAVRVLRRQPARRHDHGCAGRVLRSARRCPRHRAVGPDGLPEGRRRSPGWWCPPRTTCGSRRTTGSGPTSARATTPSRRVSSRTSSAT